MWAAAAAAGRHPRRAPRAQLPRQASTSLPSTPHQINDLARLQVERVRFSKDGSQLQLTAVDGRRALVVLPNDPELVDILARNGVDISGELVANAPFPASFCLAACSCTAALAGAGITWCMVAGDACELASMPAWLWPLSAPHLAAVACNALPLPLRPPTSTNRLPPHPSLPPFAVSEGEQQGNYVALLGNLLFPIIAFAGLFLLFRRAGDGSVSEAAGSWTCEARTAGV